MHAEKRRDDFNETSAIFLCVHFSVSSALKKTKACTRGACIFPLVTSGTMRVIFAKAEEMSTVVELQIF
jgi:hypothetical protein